MTRKVKGESMGKVRGETRKYRRQYTKCHKHRECRARANNIFYKEPKK